MPQLRTIDQALRIARDHGWHTERYDPLRTTPGFWIQPCPNCGHLGGNYPADIQEIDHQIVVSCPGCRDETGILNAFYTPNGNTPTIDHSLTQLDIPTLLGAAPPAHQWIWDGYIERKTLTVLHGDGGTGKSILAGHLARTLTTGGTCLGRRTTQGNVVIIDAENPLDEIHRRLHALDFQNAPIDRIAYYRASDPILGNTDTVDVDLLAQVLEVHQATTCILDSQRGVWAGDEKEAIEIRPLYRRLQRTAEELDCAILLIHHDRRTGNFSGSSDIHNSADTRLWLERPDPDKPERILHHAKARSSSELPAASYTFTFDHAHGLFAFTQPREPVTDTARVLDALAEDEWRTVSDVRDRAGIREDVTKTTLWDLVRAGNAQSLTGPPGRSKRAIGFRKLTTPPNSSQTREESGGVAQTSLEDTPPPAFPPYVVGGNREESDSANFSHPGGVPEEITPTDPFDAP